MRHNALYGCFARLRLGGGAKHFLHGILAGIFLFALEYLAFAVPQMSFVFPTPANNSYLSGGNAGINITLEESGLDSFGLSWNGTNYSIYSSSLVLALNFNNNSGIGENATLAADISKYKNNGTIIGAGWASSGKFGPAMSFNGSGSSVSIPDSPSLNASGGMAAEFWFNPAQDYTGASPFASMLYKQADYEISIAGGKLAFSRGNFSAESSRPAWAAGTFYHIAAIDDGSAMRLYVNGVLEQEIFKTALYIKNSTGGTAASLGASGGITLRGACTAQPSCASAPDGSLIIRNSTSGTVAYIDGSGNMCIQDANCSVLAADCSAPPDGSFIIQNSGGINVLYISPAGNLCMRGALVQNGSP